ncbi:hypothetical protein THRCLA_05899 [Thraustotheca clavata]|uniref:Uncharacterized protein n=1 Tax=Thraustotheca clavata TaxID=74557 RepID=A0A1V9ZRN1_9STRA|nr:hypothetical protein THRCLA_05899 [Thraustotheca clavata]
MEEADSRVVQQLLQRKDRDIQVLESERERLQEHIASLAWDLEVAKASPFTDQLQAFESQLLLFQRDSLLQVSGIEKQLPWKESNYNILTTTENMTQTEDCPIITEISPTKDEKIISLETELTQNKIQYDKNLQEKEAQLMTIKHKLAQSELEKIQLVCSMQNTPNEQMIIVDLESQLFEWQCKYDTIRNEKILVMQQAMLLVQAAETETEVKLESLDEHNQMNLLPWINLAHEDRTTKYELQIKLADLQVRNEQLQIDVENERNTVKCCQGEIAMWNTQAIEWNQLYDAYEILNQQLQQRIEFLTQCLALSLHKHDTRTDWQTFLTNLIEQSNFAPLPTYIPDQVISSDKLHACSWQRQAMTWKQLLVGKEADILTLQQQEKCTELEKNTEDITALKTQNGNLKKKLAFSKADFDQVKSSNEEMRKKAKAFVSEKAELTHMIGRLREDNQRLKESIVRKTELVSFYKQSLESARKDVIQAQSELPKRPTPPNTTNAQKALLKQHHDQITMLNQELANVQSELQKLETQNQMLSSRCSRLQNALKEKATTKEPEAKVPSDLEGEVKELKRRLHQKQSIIESLRISERVLKESLQQSQETIESLTKQLEQQHIDPKLLKQMQVYQYQLDGLRACIYDAIYNVLIGAESDPIPSTSIEQLKSVGFDSDEISVFQQDKMTQQVLSALEYALETTPEDCRIVLTDALEHIQHL